MQDIEDIDAAIGQFLDFARLRDAEAAVPDTDLNALVEGVVARYVRAGKPVRFQPGAVPPLPLRPRALQRLVANLIDNALRHGGRGSRGRDGHDGRVFIEVLDRGPASRGSGRAHAAAVHAPRYRAQRQRHGLARDRRAIARCTAAR